MLNHLVGVLWRKKGTASRMQIFVVRFIRIALSRPDRLGEVAGRMGKGIREYLSKPHGKDEKGKEHQPKLG